MPVYTISKVKPILPKKNNYVEEKNNSVVQQMKLLIQIEAYLGLNRMYLLQQRNRLVQFWNVYSILPLCLVCFFLATGNENTNFLYFCVKNLSLLEHILFSKLITTSGKKILQTVFDLMHTFDKKLNIQNDLATTSSSKRVLVWTIVSVLCNIAEYFLVLILVDDKDNRNYIERNYTHFIVALTTLSHDLEQVFYFTLYHYIYKRVLIVKAHVITRFQVVETEHMKREITDTEKLSERAMLDTSELHEAYRLLYECSAKLNDVMTLQMVVMFLMSGATTTLLMRIMFFLIKNDFTLHSLKIMLISFIAYLIFRMLKYNVLLFCTCYYSSMATKQVFLIQNILHDAIVHLELDIIEMRKVKAFYYLTKECSITFAVGLFKLDMALPMKYLNLCLTCLLVIIQFSTF